MDSVYFIDTTLRDGEQTPHLVFSREDKITIALMLDQLGVPEIEVGTPAMGSVEMETIAAIGALGLKARLSTWNRAVFSDIDASLACGIKNIHISLPVSDIMLQYKLRKSREWVLSSLRETVAYAKFRDCRVAVGAEDASRADPRFLRQYARIAENSGASRLRYADTVGMLDPFRSFAQIKALRQATDLGIEIHAHNDFGLATANTLAAVQAGAKYVSTTILGIGERAGNASFEEVSRSLEYFGGLTLNWNRKQLQALRTYVSQTVDHCATALHKQTQLSQL